MPKAGSAPSPEAKPVFEGLFRNTLSPGQWALLAAVPPAIVALYFLKLRRMPVEVPSTYLWRRAIEDMHVNSLWQRLRQSLLLFLQLLLVVLAMLALLRPGWQGTRLEGQRFIFLVDNSASMSATDVGEDSSGGQTRLEASKEKIAALIDQMERDMSAMIIAFADSPRLVQQFTDNRRLLKERLASIEPTAESTDLDGALRLAGGVANPGQVLVEEELPAAEVVEPTPTTLYLFTDGQFAAVQDFSLGNLNPIFVPVGSSEANNLAITAFNTRRSEATRLVANRADEIEAFVQVANYSSEPRTVVIELTLEGEFLDARAAEAPAGGTASFTFPLADAPAGKLAAKIDRKSLDAAGDALTLDNTAFAALNDRDPGAILLVTPGNLVIETALGTARAERLGGIEVAPPSTLVDEQRQAQLAAGDYDLVIFDRCSPASEEAMPRANTLFIGELPPTTSWLEATANQGVQPASGEEQAVEPPVVEPSVVEGPQVIDWNRAHPLMSYVQVADLLVGESLIAPPPPGGDVLIDSTAGPLLSVAPRESYEDLVLGFAILQEVDGTTVGNTTWFKSRSFPTFWLNVLDYMVGATGDATRGNTSPGATVELRPKARVAEVQVVGPGDLEETLRRNDEGPFVFQQTAKRGVYEVQAQDQVLQRFAVNLFDGAESDIRLKPTGNEESTSESLESVRIGYTDVVAQSSQSPARKELWRLILLAAIVVLVFEWYVYNRRVYL
ncbi:MAG: BatA and WFA domain-containing protein [Planctomycetota bacterium]